MEAVNFDEILELAWMQRERNEKVTIQSLSKESGQKLDPVLREMERAGLVAITEGSVAFTGRGEQQAVVLIRCHRLAERLLADVLSVKGEVLEAQACEFEHILSPEVTESICTLLGHPTTCPHGMHIPPGGCCKRDRSELGPIVMSLDKLRPGARGRVMYVETKKHDRLDKLASFGLLPGAIVTMHQRQPSLVVRIGETQLAMDELIARSVQVQKMPDKENAVARTNATVDWFTRRRRRKRRMGESKS
jgi:DtxR family Mn-dependent transcriptional regulator